MDMSGGFCLYQQNFFSVIYKLAMAVLEGIFESEGKYLAHLFSLQPFFQGFQ